jgi:hypothetical protein
MIFSRSVVGVAFLADAEWADTERAGLVAGLRAGLRAMT